MKDLVDRYLERNNNNVNESHDEMVTDVCKPGKDIADQLAPQSAHLWHMASCVMGEAGELFDAIKKVAIYNKGQFDRQNIVEELGDIEFYLSGVRQSLNISREATLKGNLRKLVGKNGRYSSGQYSDQQAHERQDKNNSEISSLTELLAQLENHDFDYLASSSTEDREKGKLQYQKIITYITSSIPGRWFYNDYLGYFYGDCSADDKPDPNDPKYEL